MSRPNADLSHPSDLLPRLAAILHGEGFPSGERAALKRMALSGRTPLAFHRFVLRQVPERWQRSANAFVWRVAIGALALQHGNPHDSTRSLGAALADVGFAESRLESLLAAHGRVRSTLALRAARRLAVDRVRCNWRDFGWLLFAVDDDAREKVNERIARDYYRALVRDRETA